MTRKQKRILYRILISALLFAVAELLPVTGWLRLIVFLVPYLLIGWDVILKALRNIAHGQVFDENFLMMLATVGAIGTGQYPEAVIVMLFNRIGELFESYAVGKSRKSIAALMDIRPDYANLEQNGELQKVQPDKVAIGDTIVVKPGERVPLDGVVMEGSSTLDTAALTGESVPRSVTAGDDVNSGCINGSGLLRIRVTHVFAESTVSKILQLVENASSKKAASEQFITKFSRYYTPCVVLAAVLLAVIPPLVTGGNWVSWLHRALIFLVVSCPCALVISVPLSFFGGIGGASRQGILVKGGNYLEALASADIVVFDKTGTLTRGVFNVTVIHPDQISRNQLLEYAAYAECYSDHPIAKSIREAYGIVIDRSRIQSVEEISGYGIHALIDGKEVYAGNDKLMEKQGISWHPCHHVGTTVHLAINGVYAGHLVISDEIKPDAADAIRQLRGLGISKTVMLTGDAKEIGIQTANQLGMDEVYTQLLPADKVDRMEALLRDKQPNRKLLFVGDGINDAPVLTRADLGIAMGAMGTDAAIEAADVVLMDDQPTKIAVAIRIARRTTRIVRQNIVFALAVKAIVLILAAIGVSNMWEAVFADVGVSVIAILNAMRALTYQGQEA